MKSYNSTVLGMEHDLNHHSDNLCIASEVFSHFKIYHTSSLDFDGAFRGASDPSSPHFHCMEKEQRRRKGSHMGLEWNSEQMITTSKNGTNNLIYYKEWIWIPTEMISIFYTHIYRHLSTKTLPYALFLLKIDRTVTNLTYVKTCFTCLKTGIIWYAPKLNELVKYS